MATLHWAIAVLLTTMSPVHAQHGHASAARGSSESAEAAPSCSPSWLPWAPSFTSPTGAAVEALAVFDDGTGPALYAGGRFTAVEGVAANGVAKWDGAQWSAIGGGVAGGSLPGVLCLQVFDDGTGTALYAGGAFTSAGGVPANHVARWDGVQWSPLGEGLTSPVQAMAVFDGGIGPTLAAAFGVGIGLGSVATWDGSAWSLLPPSWGSVAGYTALTTMPSGGGEVLVASRQVVLDDLYAWWYVTHAIVETWDGAGWTSAGSFGGENSTIGALIVHDDGTGPALFAGGNFAEMTMSPSWSGVAVARWDGSEWSALDGGLPAYSVHSLVSALAVFDDGTGPALYAGGYFATFEGTPLGNLAKWDGSQWSFLTGGFGAALAAFDDGNGGGNALYAGGGGLAKWGCPPPIVPVPGCAGNPATLSALSSTAELGATLSLQLEADAVRTGTAVLVLGAEGTGAAGCGLLVPGLGEVLLALAPMPLAIAAPIAGGVAAFDVPIPADPGFAGATVVLQAACVGAAPSATVELSTGVAATLTGG